MTARHSRRLKFLGEVMGLSPWRLRARQALVALRGEEDVPASRFGLSSLKQLRPRVAIPLWRGRPVVERKAIITNLFNHRQTPIEDGWSVKKTQVEDFRGRELTYDSHNGTDFSIPVGTTVCTPAPGVVAHIVSEFNRGGLKIFIDHGDGLMTNCAHLARSLVTVGQVLERGEPIAISGYSGLDALVTFPFAAPHIHFNTWLNGKPVDPFAHDAQPSMWRDSEMPSPPPNAPESTAFEPSKYSEARITRAIDACITPKVRSHLRQLEPLEIRASQTLVAMNYYPTRFERLVSPYSEVHDRRGRLDLPFSAEDFDGVVFVDEL